MLMILSRKQLKKLADKELKNNFKDEIFKNSVAIAKSYSKLYGVTTGYLIKLEDGTLVYYPSQCLPALTSEKITTK
jgi:hypothetical protein